MFGKHFSQIDVIFYRQLFEKGRLEIKIKIELILQKQVKEFQFFFFFFAHFNAFNGSQIDDDSFKSHCLNEME